MPHRPTLRRRLPLLILVGLLSACSTAPRPNSIPVVPTRGVAALPPIAYVFDKQHTDPRLLLNRLSWGANASSAAQMQALGMDRYLDLQLRARTSLVPAAIQTQINAMSISQKPFETLMRELEVQKTAADAQKGSDDSLRKAYQQELNRIAREAASRSVLREVYSSAQLQEQMSWFWMNHFNIHSGKHNLRAMLGDFEESAIRPFALGNFHDLLRATMYHPAMLRYLDNEFNASQRINENYARELLELHTMGVNSGYSQHDIQELARALTGLAINVSRDTPKMRPELKPFYVRQALFEFNPQRHDFGDKHILGQTISGRGLPEIEDIINLLCRQPATAHFISLQLATYFVSDTPTEALVNAMARSFLASDGSIPATLRVMFDAPEFHASLGHKFKDPLHYAVGAVRLAYDGNAIVNPAPVLNWLNQMGQPFNGHQTPDGYLMTESAWASPGQLAQRFDIARSIGSGTPALFYPPDVPRPSDKPPAPALLGSAYAQSWSQSFSVESRQALQQAGAKNEWTVFFLAAPEMMRR